MSLFFKEHTYRQHGYGPEVTAKQLTPLGKAASVLVGFFAVFALFGALNTLTSIKATDPGEICVVKQGGWFDDRNISEARKPGEGMKLIGPFNEQICYPATERDLTEEVGTITVPTKDGVNVAVRGQALFKLTQDPRAIRKFATDIGGRPWDGADLHSEEGWSAFLRVRMFPVLYDSLRQTLGRHDCAALNNACTYVLNAESLAADPSKAQTQAKAVNNSQNLDRAQADISRQLRQRLQVGIGPYFEDVKFQNLRVTFSKRIQDRVEEAQSKRAEVARERLEAQRKTEVAKGRASEAIEKARGERQAAFQRAKAIEATGRAYKNNPAQQKIDQTRAFCGEKGCDPQVIGGNALTQITGR